MKKNNQKIEKLNEDEANRKVIMLLSFSIIIVLGLIFGGAYLFRDKTNNDLTKKKINKSDTIEVIKKDTDVITTSNLENKNLIAQISKNTSINKAKINAKYFV